MITQKNMAAFTHTIGLGLQFGGKIALVGMAIIGTFAVDIVLLAYAEKKNDRFLSGFVWGSFWSSSNEISPTALIVSPITTVAAVLLSFLLGVPGVGMALLAGWAAAATLLVVGLGLTKLATAIDPDNSFTAGPAMALV